MCTSSQQSQAMWAAGQALHGVLQLGFPLLMVFSDGVSLRAEVLRGPSSSP